MTKLETITISETVKIIKSKSFKDCVSLKEIIIPKSVEKIEYDAFEGCTSLRKIEYKGKTDPCSDGSKIPSGTQIYVTKEYEGETFCGTREIEKIQEEERDSTIIIIVMVIESVVIVMLIIVIGMLITIVVKRKNKHFETKIEEIETELDEI